MKRVFKTLVNLLAVILLVVVSVSATGCGEKIKTVSLNVSVYDYNNEAFLEKSESTMTMDLYAHLAPKTVDKMLQYVDEGYYNNTIFYKISVTSYTQIMVGDLKLKDGATEVVISDDGATTNIVQNTIKPELPGEYYLAGVVGSDLKNVRGSIGLWRSWYETGDSYNSSSALNSGRATWYMPTASMTNYNGNFCVFGKINLSDSVTASAFDVLEDAFGNSANYTEFVIYFTGEYDENKTNENHGLEFHCVTEEYFDSLSENEKEALGIFEAEGRQLECYNQYTIKVANNQNGQCGAMIKTAKSK